jgi:DnaK suppressor protein
MAVSFEKLVTELEQQRADILTELDEMAKRPRYKVGYGNHQADDGSAAFDQAAELAIRKNAERLLAQIEAALARWETDTYGYCQRCGDPIDHARLKAIPYADLCLYCAEHPTNLHH